MQILYLLTCAFQVLTGCLVVAFARKWRRDPATNIFISFVIVAFVLIPVVGLGVRLLFQLSAWSGSYVGLGWTMGVQPILIGVLSLVSAALLLCYAVERARESRLLWQEIKPSAQDGKLPESVARQWHLDDGARWDIEISRSERVSIARRREWAFLIDLSPMMLLAIGISLSAMGTRTEFASGISRMGAMIVVAVLLASPVILVYWVMKDFNSGVSIGKWITGCRAVDCLTGKPIGASKSFLRNFLFLIPVAPLVELVVASTRPDGRRLGDLIAGTVVVKGPPRWINGKEVKNQANAKDRTPARHPLDD
jgi:uncharacterized RDD family membrane protein YckC